MTPFAELAVTTNFSFLRSGSHPEEMVSEAARLGLGGIAVTDRNTVAGVVRGHAMAKEAGYRYAPGARLAFRDGTPDVLAWPTDRGAWGRLCRLLTLGNRRAPKGECHLDLADLLEWGEGLMLGVMPGRNPGHLSQRGSFKVIPLGRSSPRKRESRTFAPSAGDEEPGSPLARGRAVDGHRNDLAATLAALHDAFPDSVRLMANRLYGSGDRRRLALLARLARRYGTPLLATNDVLYHAPERRALQDVVTCIREHCTIHEAGRRLEANAERHLKDAAEMARLFRDHPEAVTESVAVLERLGFSLDQLRYNYPDEPTGDAASPQEALVRLTTEGARERYPDGVPATVTETIAHELALIESRDYAPYFLTVHDIVRFARSRGILCQGRGSAANSAVCFCLGITEVNPGTTDLLFERFISPERDEPPDIDVDFEHERREEVMQYIYAKYGRERTGIAATVISYRTRSAVREVGKVFGLSDDTIGALAGTIWGWSSAGVREADIARVGLDPAEKTMRRVAELSQALIGFPRHLSQHVGGFVITRDRLDEMVPVMNAAMEDRTNIEWDKDDLDAVGMLKVDVLALGMLSCIRRAFDFMRRHYGWAPTLATIQNEDPAVYDMLCRADSLGVFQVESRAQMTMLPRLRPREFYDLVIEVAIVRPGPIQGDMVHPYLRRRQGLETVRYPAPSPEHGPADELEKVLGRTLGVPLFQEQAMKIAMVAAKFSGGEADKLRRAMATFRRTGTIHTFRDKMVEGMVARGYERAFAERCFQQIEGFGEYGFPESHAASFALLVYASSWIKCHYPDVFCAALLNAQPMGFYAPAQIVRDAERHGIAVRAVDINFSDFDATLEPGPPLPSWERAVSLGEPEASLEKRGEGATYSTSAHARARVHPAFTGQSPEFTELEDPLPSSPFQGEAAWAEPVSQHRHGQRNSNGAPTSPPPERGRPGGGHKSPPSISSRFDHTPAKAERARRLRREATKPERMLWSKLRSAQMDGVSFRRQHPMGPYVLDFYCPSLGIVVELDGDQHGFDKRAEADRRRDAWLASRGLRVLRFWNSELRENMEGVLDTIFHAVAAARKGDPLPSSPLQGEAAQGAPVSQDRHCRGVSNGSAPSPPPERGRSGGGHESTPGVTMAPPGGRKNSGDSGLASIDPTVSARKGDPLPSSPLQGEGAQAEPPEFTRPPSGNSNRTQTSLHSERGRSGGDQNHLTGEAPRGTKHPCLHPTNASMADAIRSTHAVRLGFRQIKGFREEDATAIVAARGKGYDSVRDLWLRSGLTRAAIERLADADAFRSLGLDRRAALWAARELGGGKAGDRLPLFDVAEHADIRHEPDVALPPMPIGEHVVNDYRYLSLSLKAHPVSFARPQLAPRRIVANQSLRTTPNGRRVTVSGLAIVRQRPGTASGVIFMTIEDETDIANIVVWPKVFEKFRPVVLGARFVAATGKVQSESGVIHVIADRLEDLTAMLGILSAEPERKPTPGEAIDARARADEIRRPGQDHRERAERRAGIRHPRNVRFFEDGAPANPDAVRTTGAVMPKGRNFH